ncbi:MAG: N-acetyl-gamma-glutamyl-phosphate reductase [Acidihalobacter sp.]|uniref:N-acetyl-gamma-glutamyl-phosphate reductase n=1 Tax=Acidihalobacter sp. TaxID=1872108 RepID=UPI00307F6272
MSLARVFIDGDQGTTGLQIHARLQGRDDIAVDTLPPESRKDVKQRSRALNECDIAILCLPDNAARQAVSLLDNPAVRVIDASSAHRTTHGWVYGFPEWQAGQPQLIAQSKRVTNPGCYSTGAVGVLSPLVRAGLVPRDYPVTIQAVSGYSGQGRAGVELYEGEHAAQAPAFQVYGLRLRHKHVPEIQQYAGLTFPPVFVPAYGAYRQGIVMCIPLQQRLLPGGGDVESMHARLAQHYADTPYVHVLPPASAAELGYLNPELCNGGNEMQLAVFANRESGQILLTAVFDNLGKGAAGAAVQNLDLMLNGTVE